jgi:hypothetical protein
MNERYGDCRTEFVFMWPGEVCAFRAGVAHRRLQAGIEAKGGRSGEHGFQAYPASGLLPHGGCADPGAGADGAGGVRHDAG